MAEYYVGIDLGTTNSAVSIYRRGRPETLKVDGNPICPSVVNFRSQNTILVGHPAKRLMMIDPDHTIASVKRKMGDLKFVYKSMHGRDYTPPEISALILKKVVEGAEKELGVPVRKAVITVPAYFDDDQRADTKKAGELAGLEVLRLLPEPTAAAVAYGLNQGKDQTILVYDLGGGTFDVSILEVRGNEFIVKAVGGDHDLGGNDFDETILNYVLERFARETRVNLKEEQRKGKDPEVLQAMQVLKETSEKAKIELTDSRITTIEAPNLYRGKSVSLELTRETFEDLIRPLVERTKGIIDSTLRDADLSPDDIDRVILVGGSTMVPMVKEVVTRAIKEPYIAPNVMDIVASGAAIVAASYLKLSEERKPRGSFVGDGTGEERGRSEAPVEVVLKDVYPHSLGTGVIARVPVAEANRFLQVLQMLPDGMAEVYGHFSELIEKQTSIPVKASDMFTTNVDYQTSVKVDVFRGESSYCKENQYLGDFLLEGIQRAKAKVPQIEVTFEIDENGMLKVSARDLATGKSGGAEIDVRRDISKI